MFGVKILIEKLNTAINSGNLTEIQLAQAFGAIDSLENHSVNSVDTASQLPDAALNKGRFFWIADTKRYVLSNGTTWNINNIIGPPEGAPNAYAWGDSAFGQLGDNTTVSKSSPVQVSGNFGDWIQVSAGSVHTLGVRANGTAWAWGINGAGGQLGIGNISTLSTSSPVNVVGGFTDWIQVSAGEIHSLGLRANGTAWAWGYGANGKLGNNAITDRSSPVSVVGGFTDWVQLDAAETHSLGIRANGTIYTWGFNLNGQLGDNTTADKSSPVLVVGGFTDWTQASGGYRYSLAVRDNGTLWGWGYNFYGMLGNNSTTDRSSPVSVVGGFTDWVQASAGRSHSLGLRANGTLYAWGFAAYGGLGDNATTSKRSPVLVAGGFTDWVQASAGGGHSLAIRANGTLWAWGYNAQGRLGTNSGNATSSPVLVAGGFTDWVQVNAGSGSTFGTSIGLRG